MEPRSANPKTVDDYIDGFADPVKEILRRIRAEVRRAAPQAAEVIKYNMPTYVLGRDILYFGAFKAHIGLFPPVREPEFLDQTRQYKGDKGNLKFPIDQPIPYELIGRIAHARALKAGQKAKREASTP